MKTLSILFIISSHSIMGDTGKPTGIWFEELTTPYYAFKDAGYAVDIVSISGGKAPIDPNSQKALGENPASVDRFLKDKEAISLIKDTESIENINTDKYKAIFLPGGHGTMWDLPKSEKLASIISQTFQDGNVIAAVCHGSAGLVNAIGKDGNPIVKGLKVSAFTNSEEEATGLKDVMPFLLETRLRDLGANFQMAPNFESFAVADGNLITGQNPASSEKVAKLVIEYLENNK